VEDAPQTLMIQDGEEVYVATRLFPLPAKQAASWKPDGGSSDLPPEHAPFIP